MDVKKILESYRWAIVEVERMKKRKKKLERKMDGMMTDTVRGSMEEFPYVDHVVKIEGKPTELLEDLQRQIDEAIGDGLRARKNAEDLITRAEELRTREILRCRYIDCMSWEQVGRENHVNADHARKIVRDFIRKNS